MPETVSEVVEKLGCDSLAQAAELSIDEVHERVGDAVDDIEAARLHEVVRQACNQVLIDGKSDSARASPLLPTILQTGAEAPADAPANGLLATPPLVDTRKGQYTAPGDVASRFSPAAYLAELYRNAQSLYPADNPWHIDQRRPDLKQLILNQDGLDTPFSTLSLSNEILIERARVAMSEPEKPRLSDDQLLEALSVQAGTPGAPYHHHHNRLRQVFALKDPQFEHLLAAPVFAAHLDEVDLACLRYPISPTLRALLIDEIDEDNAAQKFEQYFPGATASSMLQPARLRSWFGLSDTELQGFMGELDKAEYNDRTLTARRDDKMVCVTLSAPSTYINYVRLYPLPEQQWQLAFNLKVYRVSRFATQGAFTLSLEASDFGVEELLPNTEYRHTFDAAELSSAFTFSTTWYKSAAGGGGGHTHTFSVRYEESPLDAYLLKLNKIIRLYKATGLSAQALQDIIASVDADRISDQTLAVIHRVALLQQRYAIGHDDALVMSGGLISQVAAKGAKSQFDRLFNNPPLVDGGLNLNDALLDLRPDCSNEHPHLKAILKRACRADDAGLFELAQLVGSGSPDQPSFRLTLPGVSRLYGMSLWARCHGLKPAQLRALIQLLGQSAPLASNDPRAWPTGLAQLSRTTDWLTARGWSVHDLLLLTREVETLPINTEIGNLLRDMAVVWTEAERDGRLDDPLGVFTPLIASTFNLKGEALARALLTWADRAKPGGLSLEQLGECLGRLVPSEQPEQALVGFAYGLAQMALVGHACGATGDVLAVLVNHPQRLIAALPSHEGLPRNPSTIMALADFCTWLGNLSDPSGAGGALLGMLNDEGGVALSVLATATNLGQATLEQAAAQLHALGDVANPATLQSWQEIEWLSQWLALGSAYGVTPDVLAELATLDGAWERWRTLASAFQASLHPAQAQVAHGATQRSMSLALTGLLGAQLNLSAEALNKHLLLDSENAEQVVGSRLGEAQAALQQFIHLTLSTPEDRPALRHTTLSRQFFKDWTRWNARYSTWAAGQMLMYYPENYIDPTQRHGQTKAMDDMLQALGQAQINGDTVGDAFQGYLSAFEEVANLETISGYHDSREATQGKAWFVGRCRGQLHQYWWRSVDEAKRGPDGALPANAWSAWTKIELASKVLGRLIRPVVYRGRLHLGWVEREEQVISRDDQGQKKHREWRWSFKLAWLRYDGNWSAPLDYPLAVTLTDEARLPQLSLFLCAWPQGDGLLVGIYDRTLDHHGDEASVVGVRILANLESRALGSITPYLREVGHWLDTPRTTGMCAVFEGQGEPVAEIRLPLAPGSQLPKGFASFNAGLNEVRVVNVSSAPSNTYSLSLRSRLSVSPYRPPIHNRWMAVLLEQYSALASENMPIPGLLRSGHGVFLVRKEGQQYWGYLCFDSELMSYFGFSPIDTVSVYDDAPTRRPVDMRWVESAAGVALVGRYQIHTGHYPLLKMNIVLKKNEPGATPKHFAVGKLLSYAHTNQDQVVPQAYMTAPPGWVTATQVHCRVHSADGKRSSVVKATRDYNLVNDPVEVQFDITAAVGDMAEWQGNEAVHRVEYQFGNGNVRNYHIKVYKDADTLQTAIIGATDEGAQYLAHRGQVTRLNTLFARELTLRAVTGIDSILNYDTQQIPEPSLGVQVRLTLPVYHAGDHGGEQWAKVWLATAANTRIELWSGSLSERGKVFADVRFAVDQVYADQQAYHLETQYSKGLNQAKSGKSIVIERETLSVLRSSDTDLAPGDRLPKNNVDSVQAFGWNAVNRMDFTGANALYFWELFYYTPMMIMQRFLQEERFDLAEHWLGYVFNPAGYAQAGAGRQRMWNVRPLEEDSCWNDQPLQSLDPDAVAQNDPMHYKLNAFMRLLDICIGRGDAAYRKLERDTLSEARVCYQRAASLLGDAPWTPSPVAWNTPSLAQAATGKVTFLPEVNRVMLGYWETLRIRLYNLRHNLTLDGQPLSLPLHATPGDPKSLLAAAIAAEAGGAQALPEVPAVPVLRFQTLMEGARTMAAQLIQFGNQMLNILEHQDAEALASLLTGQGVELADSNVALFKQTLNELAAERTTLERSLASATLSRDHYQVLYEENVSASENRALSLKTGASIAAAAESGFMVAAGLVAAFPNVFGLANGGGKPEESMKAVAAGFSTLSRVNTLVSERLIQEEVYRRRRGEWKHNLESAQLQMATVQAQLDALAVRQTSAQMHLAHLQTQAAHAKAHLALHRGKFTGKAMYSWLRARLASIFYTFYDLTVSRCLMVQKALQWERGDTTVYLRTGTWSGAWAGLLCGEGLMLALGQMDNAWAKWQKRELEVTRTVSLAKLFDGRLTVDDGQVSLGQALRALLDGKVVDVDEQLPQASLSIVSGALSIQFGLKTLGLAAGFEQAAARRVRSIAVSLPALLGPYQDVHAQLLTNATGLPAGCDQCSISHATQDTGQFPQLNGYPALLQGTRLLPFEGLKIATADDPDDPTGMTLNFARAQGDQRALLESLSDIILHVQFTVR